MSTRGGKIQPQCTAMTRGSGGTERCKNRAMHGTTVCKKHGGKLALASQGPGNPNWKHGRHSKVFRDEFRNEKYAEHLTDRDLLSHRSEIALLDLLLDEELEAIGVDSGAAERLWATAYDLMLDFEIGVRNKDQKAQQTAFVKLRETVREGQRDAEARNNARKIIQERGQMAERELRRQLALEDVMTGEQARILFRGVMREISEGVKDPAVRADLHNRLMRLGGQVSRGAAGSRIGGDDDDDGGVIDV